MKALLLAPIALFAIAGCSSAPSDAPAETPPATTPAPAAAEPASADSGSAPAAATVAMAKCDQCSAEVPTADLVDLHGKMTCPACAAAHTH